MAHNNKQDPEIYKPPVDWRLWPKEIRGAPTFDIASLRAERSQFIKDAQAIDQSVAKLHTDIIRIRETIEKLEQEAFKKRSLATEHDKHIAACLDRNKALIRAGVPSD